MIEIDWKLHLISGEPIEVDNLGYVRPLTLRDIVRSGYETYSQMLSVISVDIKKLEVYKFLKKEAKDYATILDLAIGLKDESLLQSLTSALSLFCNTNDIVLDNELNSFILDGSRLLNHDNFNFFREVIMRQNCLKIVKEVEGKEFNPKDAKAREIIEKLKKNRVDVKKAKAERDADKVTDLADVISAVSARSNSVDKSKIFDLTLYQLYDEFNRLRMIDEYEFNIRAILAGAEKVKLRHWSLRGVDS